MHRIASGELYWTYALGDLRITALRDGYVDMPIGRLRQEGDRPFGDDLPKEVTLVGGQLRLSVNAFAIDDGNGITLVDTGASNAWHPSMGRLPQAMDKAGIDAGTIRAVCFTHTHLDHIHGLVLADGRDAFPRLARLLVPRQELGLFRTEARLARFHAMAEPFDAGDRLGAHVDVVGAHGHEVGHSCFRVSSDGESLLIWGDTVHVPSLQFDRPEVTWEFDDDQDQARESRLRLLALAAEDNHFIAGAHLDSPGIGRVVRSGGGFRFEPL
ncbi:MAG: MBL fold metallo-hydrolase [Mesorhizobium sp.]|uniref:MBL fold metallo-hydrolase n=1 Tax=Mesorhizobium sp. TaxID=1871066 RepID=UPI001AC92349|nr:MBL fold metallo-hydrolase [Mesorhizobium sp.]MBN9222053.1 MBL fold metallo-hydrolase [Mesorhizobium sp.]